MVCLSGRMLTEPCSALQKTPSEAETDFDITPVSGRRTCSAVCVFTCVGAQPTVCTISMYFYAVVHLSPV